MGNVIAIALLVAILLSICKQNFFTSTSKVINNVIFKLCNDNNKTSNVIMLPLNFVMTNNVTNKTSNYQ